MSTTYFRRLPLDKVIPAYVLERRRHGFSSGPDKTPSVGCYPRMMRRGAISYGKNDATAQFIRFIGEALYNRYVLTLEDQGAVFESCLFPHNLNQLFMPCQQSRYQGRRGSLEPVSASSVFKAEFKDTVVQKINVETTGCLEKSKMGNWNFDMFSFRRISEGRPLFFLGFQLLHKHDLVTKLKLDNFRLMVFLGKVEAAYRPGNCYHNSAHAADVTQALNCLLSEPKFSSHLTSQELFAALLAAMCHDLDHPGVNQNYLVNTFSHIAYIQGLHGSESMLERHHCLQARSILKESQLLEDFKPSERESILSLMETMILATDVQKHAEFLSHLKDLIGSGSLNLAVEDHRQFMLTIAIKAADISNPCRTLAISKCWSKHIMEEFFRQGDAERKRDLPISALCDRYTTIIPKSQSGFFGYIALPLFKAWSSFFDSKFSRNLCQNILSNKMYWDDELADMKAKKLLPESDDEAD